ncbi:lipopolysaccharide heptosyltransferase II [Estrella lausannensis]|uniref:lipopolysaccharide heptosyltransferase II n=1 Tax=Estrella lausannensis TaxID=483423 RepID=A0A0H5DQ69_9BACT|nr:lipopolysaccharide heptosyltransferase II [Estrella lausannensis]CRX38781.1 putative ADP-heptose--LPS heptosyltransferase II [Estrella lausannensis]
MTEEPRNIIIRMPNWIGDLVMATPLLSDLRNRFPKAELTVMCQSNLSPLLRQDTDVDQVLSFTKKQKWVHSDSADISRSLKLGGFDVGILTTNSFSSAWWFFRGNVRRRIGFGGNFRSLLLTDKVSEPVNKEIEHQVVTYKRLLAPLGIGISETKPRLHLDPEEVGAAKERLRKWGVVLGKTPLIGINPGAAYGSAKCWLPERFRDVTQKLMEDPDCFVLYFGDSSTSKLVNDICSGMPQRVINLAGKTTLAELVATLSLCSVLLTNDSGPMHMAAALNIPLVALFGSTNPVKTGPFGIGQVIHKQVSCSPCYRRVCPIDFRCMTSIGVNEVYEAVRKQLAVKLK